MSTTKKDLSNIKLDNVTLVESFCKLVQAPHFGGKGIMKVSINSNFDLLKGNKRQVESFVCSSRADIVGYSIEDENDTGPENEVFAIRGIYKSEHSVVDGTISQKVIMKKIFPLLVAYLNDMLRNHLDELVRKMNLTGSFSKISLYPNINDQADA